MPTPIHLNAVAGGAGGSWYVLMEGLARLVGEVHSEIHIGVVEGGGVSNHARVGSGEVPMGILNPPMTAAAIAGRPPYDRIHPALRIGVANLTTNYLHCFVEQALPLESLAAWLERRHPLRMPVDREGTVDRMVFRLTLDHFGVAEADVERWGGALVPARSYDEQLALYSARAVNALWQFMAIPSPSIEAAHKLRPLRPLPRRCRPARTGSSTAKFPRSRWAPRSAFTPVFRTTSCTRSSAPFASTPSASAGSTRRRPSSIR